MMKRLSLAIIFACCTLAMAAQDGIDVRFLGTSPDIIDFVWSYVTAYDDDEDAEYDESRHAVKAALERYRTGESQSEGWTITVDRKNGYMCLESKYENYYNKWEMCFWNMADKKHKLFAYSLWCFENGKPSLGQYDGISFLRYNNSTKKMSFIDTPGFEVEYGDISYALPRTGKDITVTRWDKNGKKTEKTLKWNGSRFSY